MQIPHCDFSRKRPTPKKKWKIKAREPQKNILTIKHFVNGHKPTDSDRAGGAL